MSTVGLNEATIAKYIREQESATSPGQAEREGIRGPVRQEVTAGRFRPAPWVKPLLGLNEAKAGVFRRWPASKGYTL